LEDISEYENCNWIHILGEEVMIFEDSWIDVARQTLLRK
jgi:hypothetical protein